MDIWLPEVLTIQYILQKQRYNAIERTQISTNINKIIGKVHSYKIIKTK